MPLPPYLQHFTDRQDQIDAFDALWPRRALDTGLFRRLCNGKSTLVTG